MKHFCHSLAVKGLLGSSPTGSSAWKHSLDSQAAAYACRYQGRDNLSLRLLSFTTRAQALAASQTEDGVSNLHVDASFNIKRTGKVFD